MIQLDNENIQLLRVCLSRHKPDLLYVIDSKKIITVDQSLGNELRDAVGDEFCYEGLRKDSEPNEYGLRLENLIDVIGRMFMK